MVVPFRNFQKIQRGNVGWGKKKGGGGEEGRAGDDVSRRKGQTRKVFSIALCAMVEATVSLFYFSPSSCPCGTKG